MMKDHPIWRPNTVLPNTWDDLSREEQIQWWKDNSTPAEPPHPLRTIKQYEDGRITKSEIPILVFERLAVDNVREFIDGCPADVSALLQAEVLELPADSDDDGWENVSIHHGATYAPWVPVEEIRHAEAECNRRYREGVRLFRDNRGSV